MDIYVALVVPQYICNLDSSICLRASSNKDNRFNLSDDDFNILLQALKSAPDSAFHIWVNPNEPGVSRNDITKNVRGLRQISDWKIEDDKDYEFEPNENHPGKTVYDLIRGVTKSNYKGSFFGTTGNNLGTLFHEFHRVSVGEHTPNRTYKLYFKLIAPKGVINEEEILDVYRYQSRQPIVLRRNQVREGGDKWEVVSSHNQH